MDSTSLINQHVFPNGQRSRWYGSQAEAQSVLAEIPAASRGVYTFSEPLQTSFGIWRVDDFPQASGSIQK